MHVSNIRLQLSIVFNIYLSVTCSYHGGHLNPDMDDISAEEMEYVSVGAAGVWALDDDGAVYYRVGAYACDGAIGTSWELIPGNFNQLDVGYNTVFAINAAGEVFFRTGVLKSLPGGCSWEQLADSPEIQHVTVSDKGHLWAVGPPPSNNVYRRVAATLHMPEGSRWQYIDGQLKQISVGKSGVWGVDNSNQVYYRTSTFGDTDSAGNEWTLIDGNISHISSGDELWGVAPNGRICRRFGMTKCNPTGTKWVQFSNLKMDMLDTWGDAVWGVHDASVFAFLTEMQRDSGPSTVPPPTESPSTEPEPPRH